MKCVSESLLVSLLLFNNGHVARGGARCQATNAGLGKALTMHGARFHHGDDGRFRNAHAFHFAAVHDHVELFDSGAFLGMVGGQRTTKALHE